GPSMFNACSQLICRLATERTLEIAVLGASEHAVTVACLAAISRRVFESIKAVSVILFHVGVGPGLPLGKVLIQVLCHLPYLNSLCVCEVSAAFAVERFPQHDGISALSDELGTRG